MKKQSATPWIVLWITIILLSLSSLYNTLSIRNVHNNLNDAITLINENTKIWDSEEEQFLIKIDKLQEQVDMLNTLEDIHWSNITSNYMEMKYLERILWLEKRVDKYVYKVIAPSQEKSYERRMKEKYHNQ